MNLYVADTHALFWYLTAHPRLTAAAKAAFDEGANGTAIIYLPSIVIAELYYLNVKTGRTLDFAAELARLSSSAQFEFVPFTADDVLDFDTDASIPEMHDRIIVGVARRLKVPCLTRDAAITASNLVPVIW